MAKQGASIFNREAQEKLRSPDDLDKYVRVTTPSKWAVLAAFVALLLGVLAWGIFGTVSTSVTGTGVRMGGEVLCYMPADNVAHIQEGDAAVVSGAKLQVAGIEKVPSSRKEASGILKSDYLVESMFEGDWATKITFGGDVSVLAEEVPLTVIITTERVAPIALIFNE